MRIDSSDIISASLWGLSGAALALTYTFYLPLILFAAIPAAVAAYAARCLTYNMGVDIFPKVRTGVIGLATLCGIHFGDRIAKFIDEHYKTAIVQRRTPSMYEPARTESPRPSQPLENKQTPNDTSLIKTRDWKTFATESKITNTAARGL